MFEKRWADNHYNYYEGIKVEGFKCKNLWIFQQHFQLTITISKIDKINFPFIIISASFFFQVGDLSFNFINYLINQMTGVKFVNNQEKILENFHDQT